MVDVDGVLVQGRPMDGRNWASELEADLGLRREDLDREFFQPFWNEVVTGRAELGVCLAPVLARLAPDLRVQEFINYWFEQDSRVDVSLLESIGRCRRRGVSVHLATNQEHFRSVYLMHVMRLGDHVDGMFYSADLGCRKPDRRFFDLIGKRLGVGADQILLVDDTAVNVEGAKAAGWQALHWLPGMSLDDALRDFCPDYPLVG